MRIILTRADILKHNPCPEGLAAFDALYPAGVLEEYWEDLRGTLIRSTLRLYLGWAIRCLGLPSSWSGADLSSADLSGANLSGAVGLK